MGRFREQNDSRPRFLRFCPIWKPSCSRKFKSRHLPLAMTLFVKAESTKEELDVDIEAKASCLCFVFRLRSIFLEGHLAKSFLGAIWSFGRNLARVLFRFGNFE